MFEQIQNQASGENFGRNYIKLVLSGLNPGETYEFTGYAREPAFNSVDFTDPNAPSVSFQWSDLATLGGLHVGPGCVDGRALSPPLSKQWPRRSAGYPIPKWVARRLVAPILSLAPRRDDFFGQLPTTADLLGQVTVYTWSDPNSPQIAQTQGATLLIIPARHYSRADFVRAVFRWD